MHKTFYYTHHIESTEWKKIFFISVCLGIVNSSVDAIKCENERRKKRSIKHAIKYLWFFCFACLLTRDDMHFYKKCMFHVFSRSLSKKHKNFTTTTNVTMQQHTFHIFMLLFSVSNYSAAFLNYIITPWNKFFLEHEIFNNNFSNFHTKKSNKWKILKRRLWNC